MFVGHHGAAFAVKRADPSLPLWVLFIAVQLLDVFWAPFVLLVGQDRRLVSAVRSIAPPNCAEAHAPH